MLWKKHQQLTINELNFSGSMDTNSFRVFAWKKITSIIIIIHHHPSSPFTSTFPPEGRTPLNHQQYLPLQVPWLHDASSSFILCGQQWLGCPPLLKMFLGSQHCIFFLKTGLNSLKATNFACLFLECSSHHTQKSTSVKRRILVEVGSCKLQKPLVIQVN